MLIQIELKHTELIQCPLIKQICLVNSLTH
ncbi:hypothetical protein BV355_05770 [Pseudomonas syringae pv. actinidiae]|nr:hypothetical protein BV355_05770 [Pseudomonas syringae pv. actinidiae]